MSTFDEGKHPRSGDGTFTDKQHQPVDVDLNAQASEAVYYGQDRPRPEHVPAWEDIEEDLYDRLRHEGLTETPSYEVVTVPDLLMVSQGEAEAAYGTNRARWLSAVSVHTSVPDGYLSTGEPTTSFTYIDPASSEEVELCQVERELDGTPTDVPAFMEKCPFNELDDLKPGADIPQQFSRAGQELMAPWHDAGVDTGRASQWSAHGFTPTEAAQWQNHVGMRPVEADQNRMAHGSPEGAIANRRYTQRKHLERKLGEQRLDAKKKLLELNAAGTSLNEDIAYRRNVVDSGHFDSEKAKLEWKQGTDRRVLELDQNRRDLIEQVGIVEALDTSFASAQESTIRTRDEYLTITSPENGYSDSIGNVREEGGPFQ